MKKKICMMIAICMVLASLTGCTTKEEKSVPVQSVAMILGFENAGEAERYAGVVVSRGETKINKDADKDVKEVLVETGDEVSEGDVLFTYDMELAELNLEKAKLELDQLNGSLTAKQREIEELTKARDKAKEEDKLEYILEIEACETDIRELNYNIAMKQKEVDRLTASLEVQEFTSPVSGRVKSISDAAQGGYSEGSDAFMTIIEAGTYRVMGNMNENNLGQLYEGAQVLVRSRLDDTVWTGRIDSIRFDAPTEENQSDYYGPSDPMSTSSRYPFYIELDDSEGLLLGQHVYIEEDLGQLDEGDHVLALPEGYLVDIEGTAAYVFAEGTGMKLEKRAVTLGAYDELLGTYVIESGLTEEDYIAWPAENVSAGMRCTEFDSTAFEPDPEDGMLPEGEEFYPEDGMLPEGEEFYPEDGMLPEGEEFYPEDDMMPEGEEYDLDDEMQQEEDEPVPVRGGYRPGRGSGVIMEDPVK